MSEILFLRLLQAEEKEIALAEAVTALRDGEAVKPPIYSVDPEAFSKVPGSPFAYWVSDRIRNLFQELPPFEGDGRTVRVGLQTGDDFRFVRAWWEVAPERVVTGTPETTLEEFRAQTFKGKKWVPLAKGGAYSPFYSDLHLVINWERDGEDLQAFQGSVIRNPSYYFRPGLTYTNATTSPFSIRCLPAGTIFSHMGQSCFVDTGKSHQLLSLIALMNTSMYRFLLDLQVALADKGRRHYEVGLIQRTPIPRSIVDEFPTDLVMEAIHQKMALDRVNELSHLYVGPALLRADGRTLRERVAAWSEKQAECQRVLADLSARFDRTALKLYGIDPDDFMAVADTVAPAPSDEDGERDQAEQEDHSHGNDAFQLVSDLLSYLIGVVFGRWDVRSLHTRGLPYPDPFAPLPPCSPGVLAGPGGLPAGPADIPVEYPIAVQLDGILPDDEGHPSDVVARIREVLSYLFADPDAIEQEACQILGVKTLRQFLASQFFPLHIQRYSKSRRKAPIYWLLQSSRKSYGLWLYYPRLNRDTLYVALREYVEPKLAHEQEELAKLKAEYAQAKEGGDRGARSLARKVEAQEDLIQEIAAFRDEIKAVADAGYDPDPDDGVLINIAPLHKLVPWKEAAACYKELKAGKYPWATMYKRYKFR